MDIIIAEEKKLAKDSCVLIVFILMQRKCQIAFKKGNSSSILPLLLFQTLWKKKAFLCVIDISFVIHVTVMNCMLHYKQHTVIDTCIVCNIL